MLKTAKDKLEKSLETQKNIIATVFNVDNSELTKTTISEQDIETVQKAKDLDNLLQLMKEKLEDKSLLHQGKVQALTLAPESWPRARVATFFKV